MVFEVKPLQNINYGATGAEEILQNVAFILSTFVFSCPMDRDFGWLPDLDSPIMVTKATNASRIYQAITLNEPRVTVEEIRIEGDGIEGKIKPIVRVDINEQI